jgi:hypothetical protein
MVLSDLIDPFPSYSPINQSFVQETLKKASQNGYQPFVKCINEYKTITIMILLILASLICFVIVKIMFTDSPTVRK